MTTLEHVAGPPRRKNAWHRRKPRSEISKPLIVAGGAILILVLLGAAFAPLLSAWGPEDIDFSAFLVAPGPGHIMGTDGNGMDIWSRILYAARIDLGVALGAVALAVCVGSLIGGLVGYIGGWVDEIAMRITDIVQAFPAFILALTVSAMFGGGFVQTDPRDRVHLRARLHPDYARRDSCAARANLCGGRRSVRATRGSRSWFGICFRTP